MWTDCKRTTRVSRVTIKIYRDRRARSPSIIVVQVFLQWYYKSNILLHNIRDHSLLLINNSHAQLLIVHGRPVRPSFAQLVEKDLSGRIPRTIMIDCCYNVHCKRETVPWSFVDNTDSYYFLRIFFLFIYFFGRARSERSFIRLFPITTLIPKWRYSHFFFPSFNDDDRG